MGEELDKKRKANTENENLLKKKKQNAENRLETNIKEYDQEMERLTEAVNKEREENFRKIKHAKEVNKKLEDDWALKRQQFEIEENRKRDAAQYIRKMYDAWKERKKKKKGRKGK